MREPINSKITVLAASGLAILLVWGIYSELMNPSSRVDEKIPLQVELGPQPERQLAPRGDGSESSERSRPRAGTSEKSVASPFIGQDGLSSHLVDRSRSLTAFEQRIRDSERARDGFLKAAHMSIDLPAELQFVPLDFDDGAIVLNGENRATGLGFVMVAHPSDATPEQALQYFNAYQPYMPGLKNKTLGALVDISERVPSLPSGFRAVSLWQTKASSGDAVYVAFFNREDRRGSYLIVMNGPSMFFSQNEERFAKMITNMKAIAPE